MKRENTLLTTEYSPWRWLVGAVILISIFSYYILWNSPSPILSVMIGDLQISLSAGGLLTSVLAVVITVMGLAYDGIRRLLPARHLFSLGLLLIALGQIFLFFAHSFGSALSFRILFGVGLGLATPVYAVLVMENFPEKERPVINTLFGAAPYGASVLCLALTVPLFHACGDNWNKTMLVYGLAMLVIVLLWLMVSRHAKSGSQAVAKEENTKGLLREVMRNRQVQLLMLADVCDLWGYHFLSSFAPTFFTTECGMSLEQSSLLFSIFPLAGLGAGLLCGFWMSRVGLRKPFTWPMHLLIFAGTLMMALGSGWLRIAGLFLAGFGNAGWSPALYTIPMEFKGMTPLKCGVAYSFIFAIGHLAGFLSPVVGGWLGERLSLGTAMVIFSFAALLAAWATFRMEETGQRRRH